MNHRRKMILLGAENQSLVVFLRELLARFDNNLKINEVNKIIYIVSQPNFSIIQNLYNVTVIKPLLIVYFIFY